MVRKPYWALAVLLAAAVLIVFIVRFTGPNHRLYPAMASSTAPSAEPVAQSTPQKPAPLRISAAKLYSEYDQNAVAANDEFAGRTLEVTGKVLSADRKSPGTAHLRIGVDQYGFNDIEADIAETDDATVPQLKKGHSVTLICTGVHRALGSVALDHCSIAPVD